MINNSITFNCRTIPINISESVPDSWKVNCWAWVPVEKGDEDNDLFIWEKDFYMQFTSTLCGLYCYNSHKVNIVLIFW